MVDYTWVANLLKEIETFSAENNLTNLSENLALACSALLSDTEGKAEISADARFWLDGIVVNKLVTIENSKRSELNTPLGVVGRMRNSLGYA